MLDCDNLKQFNDQFGHEAGDNLLREISRFLKSHIRGGDIACRYGGDEFTLILPNTPLEAAEQRAMELQAEIKKLKVWHDERSLGAITLSMGIATFPMHGKTAKELLRAADAALYRAKAEGRDRVVVEGAFTT